jgi:hypothetical protein
VKGEEDLDKIKESDLLPEEKKDEIRQNQNNFQQYFLQLQMTVLQDLGQAIKVLYEYVKQV